ncbi:hypothetical protein STEG23_008530, partial [Scotinomys teguina]
LQKKVLEKILCDNLFHVWTMDICIHIHPGLDGHSNRGNTGNPRHGNGPYFIGSRYKHTRHSRERVSCKKR